MRARSARFKGQQDEDANGELGNVEHVAEDNWRRRDLPVHHRAVEATLELDGDHVLRVRVEQHARRLVIVGRAVLGG